MTTLDGRSIKLSDLRGKRVIVDFWGTWCKPCRMMIPDLNQVAAEASAASVQVVGISDEDASKLRTFVQQNQVRYPVASAANLPAPYSEVDALPTTFVIDRKGVIQTVVTGYHDLKTLRSYAVGADYQGVPHAAPVAPRSGLREGGVALKPARAWRKPLSNGVAISAGDFDGDGGPDIVVGDGQKGLQVFHADGQLVRSLTLPEQFNIIECGRYKHTPRLLAYSNWGHAVAVLGATGREVWSYPASEGVDGAHWGDLDGDGSDELIVGMNGFGGLQAVSADGRLLWQDTLIGNVWNQAVISALPGTTAADGKLPSRKTGSRSATVLASEAGGSIRVYDAPGHPFRTLRPLGAYCAQMNAAADAAGSIHIIAIGNGKVMGFDDTGKVAWSTPTAEDHGKWRSTNFVAGDFAGDGRVDWVFAEGAGHLVVVSAYGDRLATLRRPANLTGWAVVPRASGGALLVTMTPDTLEAYCFK